MVTFGDGGFQKFVGSVGKVVSAVLNLLTFVAVASSRTRVRVRGLA